MDSTIESFGFSSNLDCLILGYDWLISAARYFLNNTSDVIVFAFLPQITLFKFDKGGFHKT